jgi:DNA-binding transcriptional ArsR family regulator
MAAPVKPTPRPKGRRREATPAEFKAMSHPLRLRILRLCLNQALTNQELAERLGQNPATVLHHVRLLVDTGFLKAERPRSGPKGALEKPYRATGKSWILSAERFPADARLASELAMVDAVRAELVEAGADNIQELTRVAFRLNQASLDELHTRLTELVQDFVSRSDDDDGELYGLLIALHART